MTGQDTGANPDLRAASWRKSSRSSGGGNGQCVEVAYSRNTIGIRDSKDIAGTDYPMLIADATTWTGFVTGLKNR